MGEKKKKRKRKSDIVLWVEMATARRERRNGYLWRLRRGVGVSRVAAPSYGLLVTGRRQVLA